MTPEVPLREAAQEFADDLNVLLDAALHADMRLQVFDTGNRQRWVLQPADDLFLGFNGFPLKRADDDVEASALLLHVWFVVEMHDEGDRLRVMRSTVGLWADITGGRRKPRPLVRVEYDRRRKGTGRAAAHVHLHANSPEIAWIYGSNGNPAPDLHSLHFPVGGRRFRPTLEDFLLFLEREKLYTDFKQDWQTSALRSLSEWERTQAASTVRRYRDTAADTLTELGYTITAPPA